MELKLQWRGCEIPRLSLGAVRKCVLRRCGLIHRLDTDSAYAGVDAQVHALGGCGVTG